MGLERQEGVVRWIELEDCIVEFNRRATPCIGAYGANAEEAKIPSNKITCQFGERVRDILFKFYNLRIVI